MRNDPLKRHNALRIAEEAAQWLQELRAGDSTRHAEYLNWLLESPQHVEAFLRVSEVDASLARVDAERSIAIEIPGKHAGPGNVVALPAEAGDTVSGRSRSARRLRTLAASVAVIGVAAVSAWAIRSNMTQWTEYSTAIGEQRSIALDDGSLLRMNTGSRVQVGYSSDERSIRLLAGEALFNVRHDPARPFRVHSGEAVVQVIGTQFDVWRRAGGVTVSVLEGRVRAQSADSPSDAKLAVVLDAGDEARIAPGGNIARGKANLARINAWPQRRLVFMNETLGAIAGEFNRYSRLPVIKVEGTAAELRDYSAMSFDADDPESLLAVLERDPGLEIERSKDQVIVRRRAP